MANFVQTQTSYTIDYPFSFNSNGRVNAIEDNNPKVWKNKILALISTGTQERIWYSDYGINLGSLVFENSQNAVEEAVRGINELFVSWLPELDLTDVQVGYDETNGYLILSVVYTLPSGEQDSVKIDTSSLSAAGETIEGM